MRSWLSSISCKKVDAEACCGAVKEIHWPRLGLSLLSSWRLRVTGRCILSTDNHHWAVGSTNSQLNIYKWMFNPGLHNVNDWGVFFYTFQNKMTKYCFHQSEANKSPVPFHMFGDFQSPSPLSNVYFTEKNTTTRLRLGDVELTLLQRSESSGIEVHGLGSLALPCSLLCAALSDFQTCWMQNVDDMMWCDVTSQLNFTSKLQ